MRARARAHGFGLGKAWFQGPNGGSRWACTRAVAEVMGPVMDFFQTLLDSLAVLLGPTFVADVISVFLTILGGEQLVRVLTDGNSADMRGATVVTRWALAHGTRWQATALF